MLVLYWFLSGFAFVVGVFVGAAVIPSKRLDANWKAGHEQTERLLEQRAKTNDLLERIAEQMGK